MFTENYIVHQGFLHVTEQGSDNCFLSYPAVSDEDVFHTNGYITRYNCVCVCFFCSTKNRVIVKANVSCAVLHNKLIGSFFFAEDTITNICYLDMLELHAVPKINKGIYESHSNKMEHQLFSPKIQHSQHFSA
jgi:hypothetical protein